MSIGTDAETKKKIIAEYAVKDGRHRLAGGAGCAAQPPHLAPDRAPQGAQARPPQPSWPAAARRSAPSPSELHAEGRHQPLPLDRAAPRPASMRRDPLLTGSGTPTTGVPLLPRCTPTSLGSAHDNSIRTRPSSGATAASGPVLGSGLRDRLRLCGDRVPRASIEDRPPQPKAPARDRSAYTERDTPWRDPRSTPSRPFSTTASSASAPSSSRPGCSPARPQVRSPPTSTTRRCCSRPRRPASTPRTTSTSSPSRSTSRSGCTPRARSPARSSAARVVPVRTPSSPAA